MYLKAWAQDDRVAFRRREMPKAEVAGLTRVGAVNQLLYTDKAERLFGKAETAAADPLMRLGAGDRDLSDRDRHALTLFIVELMSRQPYVAMFKGLSPKTFERIVEERKDAKAVLMMLRDDHGPGITNAERLQRDIANLFRGFRREHAKHNMHLTDDDLERTVPEYLELHSHKVRSLAASPESAAQAEGLRRFIFTEPWQICESLHYEFITSDQPVFYHPTWLNLNSDRPLSTLCFVVSPTILLKISATPETQRWAKDKIFKLNGYIAKHCDHQIISAPSNIQTLYRDCLGFGCSTLGVRRYRLNPVRVLLLPAHPDYLLETNVSGSGRCSPSNLRPPTSKCCILSKARLRVVPMP